MLSKDGHTLRTLAQWEEFAGPKSAIQWKDGRSAKEAARAWIGDDPDQFPAEISAILHTHPDFSAPLEWRAEPEAQVRFDPYPGEPANVDVLARITDDRGSALLVVEAKADEPFGQHVGEALRSAHKRLAENPRSRGVARLEGLAQRLFDMLPEELNSLAALRYQLLTASAAALAEASRTDTTRAVVLVQEFITDQTVDDKHSANANDLDAFLERLGLEGVRSGQMVGPVQFGAVSLYFGKVSHHLRGEV